MAELITKDVDNTKKVLKEIDYLTSHAIAIGVFGKEDSTLVMIATVQEFGCNIVVTENMRRYFMARYLAGEISSPLSKNTAQIRIPERPFIRGSFDKNQKNYSSFIEKQIDKILQLGLPAKTGLELIGEYIAGDIKKYMVDLNSPANSPMTVQSKGSSNPLIDTGRLVNSITYEIVTV